MKYNDNASIKFQERSRNREDSMSDYWGRGSNRKDRRIKQRSYFEHIKGMYSSLNVILSKREKFELYEEFLNGTNGRWSNMHQNYDFNGSFADFIEYLHTMGDERVIKYKLRLREYTINKLLS
tara:strand:+ start:14970 stop:15338 length:369 start_codon:yes stop_codon:yes gene_type:complete